MMPRLVPRSLISGATIGVVSPSSGVAASCPRRFARGLANLRALGFSPVVGETGTASCSMPHLSAPPRDRANDINHMLADPSIDAVIATIGGTGANHVLDYLDIDTIGCNPKFLIGYSDITLLQAALWHKLGLTSIVGPALLPQFGEVNGLHPFTRQSFLRVASSGKAAGILPASRVVVSGTQQWDIDDHCARRESSVPGPWAYATGAADGWLAPVNLESLLALSGTEWAPDLEGALLVLEASETTSAGRFHQGLYQLKSQGVFTDIQGLLVGRFDPRSGCSLYVLGQILADVLNRPPFPVVCDLDFGHTDPLLSLPWGVIAELNATRDGSILFAIREAAGS